MGIPIPTAALVAKYGSFFLNTAHAYKMQSMQNGRKVCDYYTTERSSALYGRTLSDMMQTGYFTLQNLSVGVELEVMEKSL